MTKRIKEADVEEYLVKRVEAVGGTAEKFTSPNRTAVPDRIVAWPKRTAGDGFPIIARVVFVECKAPGEGPNAQQARDHKRRRDMGFRVYVTDTFESVDQFMKSEGYE